MKLHIQYSQEQEVERILYTQSKYDWFHEQRYKLYWPIGVDAHSTKEEIQKCIQEEYLSFEHEYATKREEFATIFKQHKDLFSTALQNIFENIPENILLNLTRYGVGGSYGMPNRVLCNIQYKHIGPENMFHEIIHLCVEPYVQQYGITHWDKERIVDLLLHTDILSFLPRAGWQKNYRGAEKRVDSLFPIVLKNVEEFFRLLQQTYDHSS